MPNETQRIASTIEFAWKMFASTKVWDFRQLKYANLSVVIPSDMETFVARFVAYIASRELERIDVEYPSDWWQAVKARFFPAWALRRWPAKTTRHSLVASAIYPDLELDPRRFGRPIIIDEDIRPYREEE